MNNLDHIPVSHVGGTVREAVDRLFAYLDFARSDAPRNAVNPYETGTVASYSFEDMRRIVDEVKSLRAQLTTLQSSHAILRRAGDKMEAALKALKRSEAGDDTEPLVRQAEDGLKAWRSARANNDTRTVDETAVSEEIRLFLIAMRNTAPSWDRAEKLTRELLARCQALAAPETGKQQ